MLTFELGIPPEGGFSITEEQILLLLPNNCRKLSDSEYKEACEDLSRLGYDFLYLPKLVESISVELLDYFIPEQASNADISYEAVQSKILAQLELNPASPTAVLRGYDGGLLVVQSEEGDEDGVEFLRMLTEFLGGDNIECCPTGPPEPFSLEIEENFIGNSCEENASPMPCAPAPSPRHGTMAGPLDEGYSIELLIDELKEVNESKLRDLGLSESALRFILGCVTPKLSRMRITRFSKIILEDYGSREIKLDDKTKALYFLYLRHPEGIAIKDLNDYYNELMDLYQSISGRDNLEAMKQTISNLAAPYLNDANISLSRIKKAFCVAFTPTLACKYYVDGGRGGIRRIALDRSLVTWETIR